MKGGGGGVTANLYTKCFPSFSSLVAHSISFSLQSYCYHSLSQWIWKICLQSASKVSLKRFSLDRNSLRMYIALYGRANAEAAASMQCLGRWRTRWSLWSPWQCAPLLSNLLDAWLGNDTQIEGVWCNWFSDCGCLLGIHEGVKYKIIHVLKA